MDSDYDFLDEWLDSFPHADNCTNKYSAACCSCGKNEAQDALIALNPNGYEPPECLGDCFSIDRMKESIKEVIDILGNGSVRRDEIAEKLKAIIL